MQVNITFTEKALKSLPRPQTDVDYAALSDKELLNLVRQVQRGAVKSEGKIQAILDEAVTRGLIQAQTAAD